MNLLTNNTTALNYLRDCIHNLEQLLQQNEVDTLVAAITDREFGPLFQLALVDIRNDSPVLTKDFAQKLLQIATITVQYRYEESLVPNHPQWFNPPISTQIH